MIGIDVGEVVGRNGRARCRAQDALVHLLRFGEVPLGVVDDANHRARRDVIGPAAGHFLEFASGLVETILTDIHLSEHWYRR